jgi:hypothetical protein
MSRTSHEPSDEDSGAVWGWVEADPERAWNRLIELARSGEASVRTSALLEELIDQRATAFLDRIAAEAAMNPTFADLVVMAHVGDMHGPGVAEFRRLQQRVTQRADDAPSSDG